ncbi:MAG: ABC transporter permease [Clostridium sp.]|nr:ABC transporter permease [Clostridium sp.]
MLKLVICEFGKLKRKKLFQIAFLTAFVMPVFYSMLLQDGSLEDMTSVATEENGFLLLIPLSVVLAANLFFEEHDYDTLKNLMCVPVTKGRLAAAKLFVILIFDVGYELAGYAIGFLLTAVRGRALKGAGLQLYLTVCTGILIWAAAMPCVLLVVWCNKSYIISIIIAVAYTVFNYLLRINDRFVMAPLGVNIPTALPVPVIFRWLYQFHSIEKMGEETLAFYYRFQPYFVPTPVVFGILLTEAAVGTALLVKVYQRQSV